MDSEHCSFCGSEKVEILGICKICLQTVCSRCGTKQVSSRWGEIVAHSTCIQNHPEIIQSAFKFFKFKKRNLS